MSIQALREQRAAKAKTLAELVDPSRKWDAVKDQPVYDAAWAEIDELDAQIKRVHDVNERIAREALDGYVIEASERIGKDKKSEPAKLFAKWLRGGDKGLSADDWTQIRNTMSTTTNSEGGFTVQTDVANSVLDALKFYGGMRAASTVIRTEKGNAMSFPTSDGTSEVGELIAENTTATAADPTFGTKSLPVYKYSSKIIAVPFELLQDSSVDIEAFVRQRMVDRLGRITNTHFTTGTGSGQPNGIITAAGTGVTAANSTSQVTSILYATVIDLIHSVDVSYRNPSCRFMMNDSSVKVFRKILDGSSRPIFAPGYDNTIGASPLSFQDMICGYPVIVNNDVAAMAASAKSIAFGDFRYYYIRDAMEMQMFRFTDSAYAKLGQVGFLAWLRSGGNFIDVGGAVKLFVNAAS
jgi:HK97 family phage major capsid protein